MTDNHTDEAGPTLTAGSADPELSQALSDGLDAYNFPATGTTAADQTSLSIKVVDADGTLIGGLTGWTWAGLFGISMLWVREDARKDGWGSKILLAAEEEARKRGCDRACVSSFEFQAPAFYQKHGYRETGRTIGIPGGFSDVHMFKEFS